MRLTDLKENDRQLDEIPALAISAAQKIAGTKVGQTVASKLGATPDDMATLQQINPAQAAAAAKERQDQKKQVQDAIKAKQQELSDLQKQLVSLG
jgi:hypothetical protein